MFNLERTRSVFQGVSGRSQNWHGVQQYLNVSHFKYEPLQFDLNFSLKTSGPATIKWTMRVDTASGSTSYKQIFTGDVGQTEWADYSSQDILDPVLTQAETLRFYLEVSPSSVNYELDNVILQRWCPDGAWKNGIDAKIDTLRKRNIQLNFNGIAVEELEIDVEQLSHKFPFGHAVQSTRIQECQLSGIDNAYCAYVRDNYNWIVDTYR